MRKIEPIRDEQTLRESALFKDRYVGGECPECHQGNMVVTAVWPMLPSMVERTCNSCNHKEYSP